MRALVDVAAQALSPAVNAPTTAVQVLDRLQDFLRQMAPRTWPSGLFADRDGTVRLVIQVRGWDQFVDLALTEITEFGAGSPQVTRRLADLIDSLKDWVPDERRPVLIRHQTLLNRSGRAACGFVPGAGRDRPRARRPRPRVRVSGKGLGQAPVQARRAGCSQAARAPSDPRLPSGSPTRQAARRAIVSSSLVVVEATLAVVRRAMPILPTQPPTSAVTTPMKLNSR